MTPNLNRRILPLYHYISKVKKGPCLAFSHGKMPPKFRSKHGRGKTRQVTECQPSIRMTPNLNEDILVLYPYISEISKGHALLFPKEFYPQNSDPNTIGGLRRVLERQSSLQMTPNLNGRKYRYIIFL
jgi:hypothetical protein